MAWLCARMTAQRLTLPARLLTRLGCVLALTRPVAILPAKMRAAFERLATNLAAARIYEPTRYIFHYLLAAQTILLGQEWALGASIGIGVAVVRRLRMTTGLRSLAWEGARRWLCAAWLRRIQDGSPAVTRNLLEDRLSTGIACAFVAELGAGVSSAFQRSTTDPGADMLCLDIFVKRAEMGLELLAHSLTLNSLLFSRAASLSTGVSTTMQGCLALTEALGRLNIALVANTHRRVTTTSTLNWDFAQTSSARAGVAYLVA